jgi:hypothetical protein
MIRAAVPIEPDPPMVPCTRLRWRARSGHTGRGVWLLLLLVASGLLASCAQEPPRTGAPGEDSRRALADARKQGTVRAVVRGNPFGMDQVRLDTLVTQAMAEGVSGLDVSFTTYPDQAAVVEPHLVVILNPAKEPPMAAACRDPDTVATTGATDTLDVFAVFCQGDQPLDAVNQQGRVAGPTDRNFQRLLWRTAAELFPDNYAQTYGFGILPRWFNLGVGGTFGF